MYCGQYQSGQRISEATAVMNTMKEAIELTLQMTTKGLTDRIWTRAFISSKLYKDRDNTKYLDESLP